MMKASVPALLAVLGWSVGAAAAVTPEEADHLGKDLTALGAERAGNKDGTIPAYEGGEASLPGWSWGKVRSQYSKFKDEKPLFLIDASNVDKYKDHLSDGQITALKTVKAYRMDVYPSHRTCNISPLNAERTKQNATEARIGADGWSLEHAKTAGIPFPIPKSGVEAMYNVRMRPQGLGAIYRDGTSVISPRPGTDDFTWYQWFMVMYWPFQRPERPSVEADGNVEFFTLYKFSKPAALAGQAFLGTNWMNKDPEAYYYFPGQRRVRRLPSYVFDVPIIGFENQYLYDEQLLLWSTLDRFDYKMLGKQEMYIENNALHMYDYTSDPKKIFLKSFINPDNRRYELHRVWVVEARIKPGFRHLAPHRKYYIDEDTWDIVLLTDYDRDDKVGKHDESMQIPIWELGGSCGYSTWTMWDVQSGRYVEDGMSIGGGADIRWVTESDPEAKLPYFKPDFYTPETLRTLSER